MKFSVIIPVFNGELYIKKCLDSILNQNFNDYYKNLKKSIEGDMQFKAQLKLKSRTMFVKEFFLDRYIKTLNNLKGKIEKTLNEG